jgi:hypothetical protein
MKFTEKMLRSMDRSTLEKVAVASGKLTEDEAGVMETNQIIALMIGAVFVSALLPTIMTNLININMTGWGSTETTLVGLLPIFVAIMVVAKFAKDV